MDGELWTNGEMEREGEWLERKMVSRHTLGQHNNMERRNVLRVDPDPSIYNIFRALSPWLGL